MAPRHAQHDGIKAFLEKHWPWVAGFVSSVAVLQYQVGAEVSARKELAENVRDLAKVVAEERDVRRDLSTTVANLTTSTANDKKEANAGLERLSGTLGTIRDSLLQSGGVTAQPMVEPLAPRRP